MFERMGKERDGRRRQKREDREGLKRKGLQIEHKEGIGRDKQKR